MNNTQNNTTMNSATTLNWTKSNIYNSESAKTEDIFFYVSKSGRSWYLMTRYTTKAFEGYQVRYNTKKEAKQAALENAKNIYNSILWQNAKSI